MRKRQTYRIFHLLRFVALQVVFLSNVNYALLRFFYNCILFLKLCTIRIIVNFLTRVE